MAVSASDLLLQNHAFLALAKIKKSLMIGAAWNNPKVVSLLGYYNLLPIGGNKQYFQIKNLLCAMGM